MTEGGYLPHVAVTSLSLSLGDINPNTGMPTLAGPYAPNAKQPDHGGQLPIPTR